MLAKPRVKICCVGSLSEAALAVRYGASALGLVSAMPSGPGVIPEETIAAIAARTPPGVASFLLTSERDAGAIIAQHRRCRTNTIQIVDSLERGEYGDLRRSLPGVALVQVIHVTGQESFDEAMSVAQSVDALLLDSGNPALPVKELGGTGRVHDWRVSRRIADAAQAPNLEKPVFLAGGLNAANVGEAIRAVRPFGLDLCGGVRTAGALDETKLRAFFQAVAED